MSLINPDEQYDSEDYGDRVFSPSEIDTSAAMQPVSVALKRMPQLRSLQLGHWTLQLQPLGADHPPSKLAPSASALAAWQQLARVLPTLLHLTRINLHQIQVPNHYGPDCVAALASGLRGMHSLRSLSLCGSGAGPRRHLQPSADLRCCASLQLGKALGSLKGLTQLALTDLAGALSLQDCCALLPKLTGLRTLTLDARAQGFLHGGRCPAAKSWPRAPH